MAAGDRTDKIHNRVRSLLGVADIDRLPDALIYGMMDDCQRRIAEDTLCLETSGNLTVTSGTASEPTGFYRQKFIALPSGSTLELEEVTIEEYDAITRTITFPAPQKPLYFKRWNGTWTFYPTPDNGTYTLYYWKIPTTNVSTSVDPETPDIFDLAIEYMTIARLSPHVGKVDFVQTYETLCRDELQHAIESRRRTKKSHGAIYYHDF